MMERVIQIDSLGKKYKIGERENYRSFRELITSYGKNPIKYLSDLGAKIGGTRENDDNYVWALKDVSFEVKPGQVLGVIGSNGAGKTTLLKILSRITKPTEGRAVIRGRIGALLEVGTGFHSELTGRENVFLSGAILGMKKAEILNKFDEIVDFAGVSKFIDTPVKRYSSGMYLRLAFAVAAHLEPDILMVDEVLAVGDLEFQQKCLGALEYTSASGRTVLFVSHNMTAVRTLCDSAVWMDKGKVRRFGVVDEVVDEYIQAMTSDRDKLHVDQFDEGNSTNSNRIRLLRFEARTAGRKGTVPQTGVDAEFVFDFAIPKENPIVTLDVIFGIFDDRGGSIFGCGNQYNDEQIYDPPPFGKAICRVPKFPLRPGNYRIDIILKGHGSDRVELAENTATFRVNDGGHSGFKRIPHSKYGDVLVSQNWICEPIDET
ncbi:MAG: ATP-binding cassette domain-containing protein [Nitrospinaceae bacterium]|jgi:lipopolysaccharide transport system ATP-binding protein|nr:ATP-binding cassette domain-containing protein [Nitrospinaceae bacterium]MBT5366866.1 ATP-binding cassette domain-containing protein [Nitrospinaceae bacterium]